MKPKKFDIIVVPFPFTDQSISKKRPAIVLSQTNFNQKAEHSICAMITSSKNDPWPNDLEILDLESCGLPAESKIRMKLFTIDHKIIIRKCGVLNKNEQVHLDQAIIKTLDLKL